MTKSKPNQLEERVNMILVRVITNSIGVGDAGKEIADLIATERKEAVIDTLKQVREREWKPAYPPESEEEKGYQKGLMAQIALTNRRIDDLISELTNPNENTKG